MSMTKTIAALGMALLLSACASTPITPNISEGFAFRCSAENYARRAEAMGYKAKISHTDDWIETGASWWVSLENGDKK